MNRPVIFLFLAFACAAAALQCKKKAEPLEYVVDFITGEVSLTGAGGTSKAAIGDVVREGMTVATGERSFARISFGENFIKIYEQTELAFSAFSRDPDSGAERTEMRVEKGAILSSAALRLTKGDLQSVSSETMIAAVRGTEYLYSVDRMLGLVACYRGAVSVLRAGSDEEVLLHAGEMVYVKKGEPMRVTRIPAGFRYKNFEYGKDPLADDAAAVTAGVRRTAEAAKPRGAAADSPKTGEAKTAPAKAPASAAKVRTAAVKTAATGSATKTARATTAVKKRTEEEPVTRAKAVDASAAAVKKETAADTVTGGAASPGITGTNSAAAAAEKVVPVKEKLREPGAILQKPRVGLPDVE
ncbi:MAG: FecR domain-containing protein [Spirochaetes bacterium]|nr:FecR domain-containing protein [Spirochaetota bacterium]